MWHTALWSCTHIPNKYYLKNNYLTLRSKVKVPRRSIRYATHRLMVMHPYIKYHWPISEDSNVMARRRKYYLKNNYLTLRSTVKVPRRSLWCAKHRLMVMHPYTKYHWPISKDKKLWPVQENTIYLFLFDLQVKGQGPIKGITVCDIPPYGHAPTYQINTI
jgi:hypothetical protein